MVSNSLAMDVEVIETTPTELKLRIPAGINNQAYTIKIRDPNEETRTVTATQKITSTPTLSLLTYNPASPGSKSITLNRTSHSSVLPDSLYIFNALDP